MIPNTSRAGRVQPTAGHKNPTIVNSKPPGTARTSSGRTVGCTDGAACSSKALKSTSTKKPVPKKDWNKKWLKLTKKPERPKGFESTEARAVERIRTKNPFGGTRTFNESSILIYYSPNRKINLNGVRNRYNIRELPPVCRHLARAHLEGIIGRFKKPGGNKFEAIIKQPCEGIPNDDAIKKKYHQRTPAEAHCFKLKNLTVALHTIANKVWMGNEGSRNSYLFSSTVHDMAIHVEKSDGMLKIIFYDPNDTLRHKKFVMAHPDQIKSLEVKHFFTESHQAFYFGAAKKEGTASLTSDETIENRDDCQVSIYGEFDNSHILLANNLYGLPGVPSVCDAESAKGEHGLISPLMFDYAPAIRDYLRDHLVRPNESISTKAHLTEPPTYHNQTGLWHGICNGSSAAVKAYIQGVLESGLDQAEKMRFLVLGLDLKKHEKQFRYFAQKIDQFPAFTTYLEMVQNSELDDQAKSRLIGDLRVV